MIIELFPTRIIENHLDSKISLEVQEKVNGFLGDPVWTQKEIGREARHSTSYFQNEGQFLDFLNLSAFEDAIRSGSSKLLTVMGTQKREYWDRLIHKYPIDAWMQFYDKGDRMFMHDHQPNPNDSYQGKVSGVYFVQAEGDEGDLVLERKDKELSETPFDMLTPKESNFYHFIKPETGKIVFFPSYLSHCSEENKTDKRRIVISFNVVSSRPNSKSVYDAFMMKSHS